MTADALTVRQVKYLLWTLMLLNVLALYLLRHPPGMKAGGTRTTSYAALQAPGPAAGPHGA